MNIADRIQHLRKVRGISQEELADKVGVSRQAVSKWESEQSMPDIDKIIIMSDFFEVTTDYLLRGIETEKIPHVPLNAMIFVYIATALNFIGLIMSWAVWYEDQNIMALCIGLILMAVGCVTFGIGQSVSNLNVYKGKRVFVALNIWIFAFILLSVLYNMIFSYNAAPYPLLAGPYYVFQWPALGVVYIVLCAMVTITQLKKVHRG
jgi:transcriptional regulator with XRE-family HTH domain